MFDDKYIVAEFDDERRILHISYKTRVRPTTRKHLDLKFSALRSLLDKYTENGRIYLVIDMSNIILEPELKYDYAKHAKAISDEYIMPGGIARYGYQITRITVRSSYNDILGENPNIFNSREEAYTFIYRLIEEHRAAGMPSAVSR